MTVNALRSLVLAACLAWPAGGAAQSLIVGIPNAETTPRGRFALTHESQALLFKQPVAWNSFSFITYGVSDHVEASLSLTGLSAPRSGELSLGAGLKWVVPILEHRLPAWELRATVGASALFSLDRRSVGGWGYAHGSFRIPRLHTRITAGVSYGSEELFGYGQTPIAAMVGVEQPITDWFWIVADWYSGNHALGAFIPAVQFNIGDVAIITGYKRDNDRTRPSDAIIFEMMTLL